MLVSIVEQMSFDDTTKRLWDYLVEGSTEIGGTVDRRKALDPPQVVRIGLVSLHTECRGRFLWNAAADHRTLIGVETFIPPATFQDAPTQRFVTGEHASSLR